MTGLQGSSRPWHNRAPLLLVAGSMLVAGTLFATLLRGFVDLLNRNWDMNTSAGMRHLANIESLNSINLQGTAVTETGLSVLKKMKNLEYLGLPVMPGAQILKLMKGTSQLKSVGLKQNSVSPEILQRLKEQHPDTNYYIYK